MSSFTALNVVYEDESESEIDDSKELQIEEALKLYQNALKLHSLGPAYYDEAEAAYKELLHSEVFSYAEFLSESRWLELYGDTDALEDGVEEDLVADLPPIVGSGEGAPSTLPQVLFLAYKNHGQFRLDRIREQLSQIERGLRSEDGLDLSNKISEAASIGLQHLAEALDRDESDLELWRKIARVGDYLGSKRIARYCLETVLDNDEAGPLSLEAAFASEQLAPLLTLINDQIDIYQLQDLPLKQQHLIRSLQKHIDPYPYLPKYSPIPLAHLSASKAVDQEIEVPLRTWASCGAAILIRQTGELLKPGEKGAIEAESGARYCITLPTNGTHDTKEPSSSGSVNEVLTHRPRSKIVDSNGPRSAGEDEVSNTALENETSDSPTNLDPGTSEQALLSSTDNAPDGTILQVDSVSLGDGPEDQADGEPTESPAIGPGGIPTRKRSVETAELADEPDVGRSRSKRIKARGSMADPTALKDTTAEDWTTWYKQQLDIYIKADNTAFEAAGKLLSKFGCPIIEDPFQEATSAQESVAALSGHPRRPIGIAGQDLRTLLDEWDLAKSKTFLHSDSLHSLPGGSASSLSNASFSSFLTQSSASNSNTTRYSTLPDDYRLDEFVNNVNQQEWTSLSQLAFKWVQTLLQHDSHSNGNPCGPYEAYLWPDDLKKTVVLLLVNQDEFIYEEINRRLEELRQSSTIHMGSKTQPEEYAASEEIFVSFVQTIFELHLDIYSRITNPSSEVDITTRTLQRDRLGRWAAVASTAINESSWSLSGQDPNQIGSWQVMYRFLWASVVCNNLLEPSMSEYTVTCFQHLAQQLKKDSGELQRLPPVIHLPNNAIMSEISAGAAEREVSRLTTIDFFTSIFSSSDDDPVSVIEKLEPLLLLNIRPEAPRSQHEYANEREQRHGNGGDDASSIQEDPPVVQDPRLMETLQFLGRANLSMRLILWQRLQDAYSVVNYPPQILACNLWSLVLIVKHINSLSYAETATETRRESLLRWLNRLDELMTQTLALSSTNPLAFECVDNEQIRLSMEAVASLQRIVHIFGAWEDTIRVGQTQPTPQPSNAASKAQLKSAERFREMMVKTWTLQYVLIKEAMVQNQEVHISNDELINYLGVAHNALGLRTYCGLSNKMFLKLSKAELQQMKNAEGWDFEMPQIIFDLYGVKISSAPADMQDHSCEPVELDRSTALDILDLVLLHVNRLSIKDLLRNDIRFAVDKMQQVIRVPKATSRASARNFNKRLVNNYLKAPINSVDLYRSLRGIGELCSTSARTDGWMVAAKGWYFLLGHIALTKFRSQKRITAGSIEDLEHAKVFFKQDLEFETERWETWYRLAQVYDTQIDESITWTAEKLESDKEGLVTLQRQAILCYIMAVAVAKRCEELSFEDAAKIASLYADFGNRLYASTREPLNGKAFLLDDFKKQFNGATRGMYEGLPFRPMPTYSVWKVATALLRQASKQKPDDWYISYMLGKVLWKMYNCPENILQPANRLDYQLVIDTILHSMKCVSERRDSRHPEKDPILEPHYKLVSVVHKLVRTKRPQHALTVEKACHILKATPYARKVPEVQDSEDWEQYILAVLKALRSADKSNWHHRMVVRAAHVIYDENPDDMLAVLGAKHELTQQIFTKTMTIQVWKPDNERPGRHFVYTGRYVLFFAELLAKTKDKENMENLARRIRRKMGDFADHSGIWREFSTSYLNLLREMVPVPRGYEDYVFKAIDPEDFVVNATRLEAWVLAPTTTCQHIDILRDALEYKKINNGLLDKTLAEDLIADTYARIYDQNVDDLKAKETAEENRVRMSVDNILVNPTSGPPTTDPSGSQGADPFAPVKRRLASVTRRQIILKAEALIVKPPPIATPKPAPRALAPMPDQAGNPALAVVVPRSGTTPAEPVSVPGSVHDSADDESELSEVEDVEDPDLQPPKAPPKPNFFPNLLGAKADEDDGESNLDGGTGHASAVEDADATEEEVELEDEAEEPATPATQGHVPSGGFMSSRKLEEGQRGDAVEN